MYMCTKDNAVILRIILGSAQFEYSAVKLGHSTITVTPWI